MFFYFAHFQDDYHLVVGEDNSSFLGDVLDVVPIDMLRLKLSFFGALKFDPRSDKWLRICMFQGAPLPDELKQFNDNWIYNSLN